MKNKIVALCSLLMIVATAYADDLEVYTSSGSDAKVLFVLDASGSMLLTDAGERTGEFKNTRMQTLNNALRAVTEQSIARGKGNKLQFGMTWFGGLSGSGIKLPMRSLSSPVTDLPNVSQSDSAPGEEIAFSDLFLNTAKNIFPVDMYDSAYYTLEVADLWKGEPFDEDSSFEITNVFACSESGYGAHPTAIDVSSVDGFKQTYASTYQSTGFADDNSTVGGILTDPAARPLSWAGVNNGAWADKNGNAMPATWIQRCPAIPPECTLSGGTTRYWNPSADCFTRTVPSAPIKPFLGEWRTCEIGSWTEVRACQSPMIAMLNDTVTLQTPTVDALFESSRYFRGENVFFGNRDRFPTWDQERGRFFDDLIAKDYRGSFKIASGYPGNMERWTGNDSRSYSAVDPFNRDFRTSGWLWGWRAVNPAAVTAETRDKRREFISESLWESYDAEHILANDVFKYHCVYGAREGLWSLFGSSFHACNIQESPYTALTDAINTNEFSVDELREIDLQGTSDYPSPGESEYFDCETRDFTTATCNLNRTCNGDGSDCEDRLFPTRELCEAEEGGIWLEGDGSNVVCDFRVKSLQQYESPVSECSNNAIILISDGSPTSNSADNGLFIDPDMSLSRVTFGDINLNTAGLIRGMIAAEEEGDVRAESISCADIVSNNGDVNSNAYITNQVGKCGPELTKFMATTPQIEGNPNSTVKTHAIGFNISGPAETFLQALSENGEGLYRSATNQEDLVTAIDQMISVSETVTSEAPALVINLANSNLESSNVVYAPQFKASSRSTWISNIKAYFLSPERDDDNSIIESTVKYAVGGSRSLWSAEDTVTVEPAAGEDQEAGTEWENRHEPSGLVEQQIAHGGFNTNLVNGSHRDIFMECDDNCGPLSYYKLNTAMPDLNLPPARYYGLASGPDNTPTEQDEIKADEISDWFSRQPLGDSLHSKPVLVSYTGKFDVPNVGNTEDPQILFVVSNRGLLHAFDVTAVSNGYDSGNAQNFISPSRAPREIAAWLPAQLGWKVNQQYYADGNDEFIYGLDGEIRIWRTVENDQDKTYLLLGMRRGGNAYYKFDISNPAEGFLQKPLWRIHRDFNYDGISPYAELGQTWSPMSVMKVKASDAETGATGKFVGVFGGGYDEVDDIQGKTRTATANQKGRGVYFIDMDTGRLLASIGSGSTFTYDTDVITTGVGKGMQWGVPSEIRVIDSNGDTYADKVFFGDMGGQLWQVEVGVVNATGGLKVTPRLLADLGSDVDPTQQRRFYEPPAVAKTASGEIIVVAGSGYRAHPLNGVAFDENQELYPVIEDGLYVVKENADAPLSDAGFANVLSATADLPIDGSTKAWKLPLNRSGEKILSEPSIFSNRILFTSTRPTSGGDSCSISTTENRFYSIKLFDGSASGDLLDSGTPSGDPEPVRDIVINSDNAIESEIAISIDGKKEGCEPGKACGDFYVGVTDVGDYETVPGKVYWKETGKSDNDCRFDVDTGNTDC